jgi:hypothetical protein
MIAKMIVCADNVIVDQLSNGVSIFGLIEEITPSALPAILPRFAVLAMIERKIDEPSAVKCSLKVGIKGEKEIIDQKIVVDFGDKQRNRSILTMMGMPIPSSGILETCLWYKRRKLGQYDVIVNVPPTTAEVQHQQAEAAS